MPSNAASLSADQYLAITSYILQRNGGDCRFGRACLKLRAQSPFDAVIQKTASTDLNFACRRIGDLHNLSKFLHKRPRPGR